MNDNSGPQWCMNSDEVGAGILVFVGFMAAAFILAPAFFVGYMMAGAIWDVKIFKYPMAAAFTVGYFFALKFIYAINPIAALISITLIWLLVDFAFAKGQASDMWMVKTVRKTFGWLFSA